jgi:hypothetical protein
MGGIGRGLRSALTTRSSPLNSPSGFFFCFCGTRRPFDGAFQADVFGRGRCNQRGKFSGPPLLEASLKVKRNHTHNQSSAFVVAPVSRTQRAWSSKGSPTSVLSFKFRKARCPDFRIAVSQFVKFSKMSKIAHPAQRRMFHGNSITVHHGTTGD